MLMTQNPSAMSWAGPTMYFGTTLDLSMMPCRKNSFDNFKNLNYQVFIIAMNLSVPNNIGPLLLKYGSSVISLGDDNNREVF